MKLTIEGYKQLPTEARATVDTIVESSGVSIDDVIEIRTTPLTISFTVLLRSPDGPYIVGDDVATDTVCRPLLRSDWMSLKEILT